MIVFLNTRMMINGSEWVPETAPEFISNITTLFETLKCFIFLNEASIQYSSVEIDFLLNNLECFEEFSDYSITNPRDRLRIILMEIESYDWTMFQKQKTDYLYHFVSDIGVTTTNVTGTSIAEACEYKFEGAEVALLNLSSSQFNGKDSLNILRNNINPPKDLSSHPLAFISEVNQSVVYYHTNRKKRKYNWNPKHGQDGKGLMSNKDEEVSPLECTKEQATILLETAVGYRKSTELYVFDSDRNKIMVFKCDSKESNSYHSYHPINQSEVEEEVRKFLMSLNN